MSDSSRIYHGLILLMLLIPLGALVIASQQYTEPDAPVPTALAVEESTPAGLAGLVMPPPLSLQTTVIRWLAWMFLLTAIGLALVALIFLRGRRRLLGMGLLALFLITFVPPFSYLPDPLGMILSITGGYHYDPRLPLVNRFLVASDPTTALRPVLDPLLGQTGAEPLNPASPLARYEFVRVETHGFHNHRATVKARFTYADGTRRTYRLPVSQSDSSQEFYGCCWRYEGPGKRMPVAR